jgi:hypothetical protein
MKRLGLIFLFLFVFIGLKGQVYLQVEQAETTDVERFSVGDRFEFKTKDIEGWQKGTLERLLPEPQSLLFNDAIVNVSEISHVKLYHPAASTVGMTFMFFGATWLVAGGTIEGLRQINAIDTQYEFGWDTLTIGASAMATGYLIHRFLGSTVRRINSRNRVRVLDLRP